jgi:hypothetical protein
MRYEWYVCKYENGKRTDTTPLAMTKEEAQNLALAAKIFPGNSECVFKVVHRSDL